MSHASFATVVPHTPIAKPTSAAFSAGASFVPSPVTATTSRPPPPLPLPLPPPRSRSRSFSKRFDRMMPVASAYLSSGDDRARTRSLGHTASILS